MSQGLYDVTRLRHGSLCRYASDKSLDTSSNPQMVRFAQLATALITLTAGVACASVRATSPASIVSSADATTVAEGPNAGPAARSELPCSDCSAIPIPSEINRAVEARIADLKARGGDCSRYGAVLESSYRSGQITLRPYMWRTGSHLTSGEAKPNGDMMLAREVDSLNVGVRTVDDVIWTMEHEAAHIAFDLASGNESSEEKANQTVRACKA